jgi:hypothetical protein
MTSTDNVNGSHCTDTYRTVFARLKMKRPEAEGDDADNFVNVLRTRNARCHQYVMTRHAKETPFVVYDTRSNPRLSASSVHKKGS